MPTYNDCGIVLHSKNLADSDKILSIYTNILDYIAIASGSNINIIQRRLFIESEKFN